MAVGMAGSNLGARHQKVVSTAAPSLGADRWAPIAYAGWGAAELPTPPSGPRRQAQGIFGSATPRMVMAAPCEKEDQRAALADALARLRQPALPASLPAWQRPDAGARGAGAKGGAAPPAPELLPAGLPAEDRGISPSAALARMVDAAQASATKGSVSPMQQQQQHRQRQQQQPSSSSSELPAVSAGSVAADVPALVPSAPATGLHPTDAVAGTPRAGRFSGHIVGSGGNVCHGGGGGGVGASLLKDRAATSATAQAGPSSLAAPLAGRFAAAPRDGDWHVRLVAADALAQEGRLAAPERAREAAEAMLDRSPAVRQAASRALRSIGAIAVPECAAMLGADPTPRRRKAAARALVVLAEDHAPQAVAALSDALTAYDEDIRVVESQQSRREFAAHRPTTALPRDDLRSVWAATAQALDSIKHHASVGTEASMRPSRITDSSDATLRRWRRFGALSGSCARHRRLKHPDLWQDASTYHPESRS